MTNDQSTIKKYPLLPYSQLVYDVQKTNADVYTFVGMVRIPKRAVDLPRLRLAAKKAICNHPVFQMHIDEEGMQHYEPQSDFLHGQYHSVKISELGDAIYIEIRANRILGDGKSDVIITEDAIRAYKGQSLLPDNYLNYLKSVEELKKSPRYAANRQWLEAKYGNLSCPVHPQTDIPTTAGKIPIEGTLLENFSDLQKSLYSIREKYLLSLTAIFSLSSALAIMDYNGSDAAALTWAYEGRESKEEQRIYGSLHRDIPFTISRKSQIENHKSDLINETRKQFREGIAHSSYPFTLTKPHTEVWNYALNVLVQPSMTEKMMKVPFPFEIIESTKEGQVAYSLLDVEIYDGEALIINYRYSATHYKESSIRRFAALVRKYVEWLVE